MVNTFFMKKNTLLNLLPIFLLALALLPMPYAYYQVMRWLVAGFAAFISWEIYQKPNLYQQILFKCFQAVFVLVAILYNPISPIHLPRDTWCIVNILSILVWVFYLFKIKITHFYTK